MGADLESQLARQVARTTQVAQRVARKKIREETKKGRQRDARLTYIGIVVEQYLKRDAVLLLRVEESVREVFSKTPRALEVFGLDGPVTWFDEMREAAGRPAQDKSAAIPLQGKAVSEGRAALPSPKPAPEARPVTPPSVTAPASAAVGGPGRSALA